MAQLPARTPTATAMAAMTLDHLSGGRVVLGLGAHGLGIEFHIDITPSKLELRPAG